MRLVMKNKNLFLKIVLFMLVIAFGIVSCDLLANKTLRVPDSMITKELNKKLALYEEAQVAEYWVVRPEEKELDRFVLQNGKYTVLRPLFAGSVVSPEKFPELQINLNDIF